jgi:hypothetical protein
MVQRGRTIKGKFSLVKYVAFNFPKKKRAELEVGAFFCRESLLLSSGTFACET